MKLHVPTKEAPDFAGAPRGSVEIDAHELARALAREVEGEVRFGSESRALYASDGSNYRQVPIGVVIPRTIDDVVATHAICREFDAPITCRGGGTSLSGETVNVAVIVDFSKYLRRVLEIDPDRRLVRVEPGAINEEVNDALEPYGLVFGPDPSTHAYCTIGGNIGNNSCGAHSVLAALEGGGPRTSDNVEELEILTYDGARFRVGRNEENRIDAIVREGGRRGRIYEDLRELRDRYGDLVRNRFPDIPRRVSGYNLDELLPERGFNVARALAGTEGTCATVLEATLNLVPNPKERVLVVVPYEDIFHAADDVEEIMSRRPIACEAMDQELYRRERRAGLHRAALEKMPEGGAWLIVEFGGDTREEALARAEGLRGTVLEDRAEQRAIWEVREAGLGATAFPEGEHRNYWEGWEDAAVPPARLGGYLRDFRRLLDEYGYRTALYGHFGQGCVHARIDFDLRSARGLESFRRFVEEAAELVASYGGSLSGEHGDGQSRGELLDRMFGSELVDAFREFKRIWDPHWKMNPGKVVDAYRLDENLKLGTSYNPPRPSVKFSYRHDDFDFAHAALRCVGVGKCRIPSGDDVMCPSYIATQEEMHTTRGRARLLFEMLQGEVVTDGWRSQEVFEALDLCLACKGCTNDCPVDVDMPTYKAEFLYHHWARRLRPRHAYAFGFVDQVARLASRAPELANLVARTRAAKWAAGVAPQRRLPRFAPVTLQRWFRERGGSRNLGGRRVLLWPDTFNNHFHVEVGIAAVESLEALGWEVAIPDGHVCCGRPLYDYGFLDAAERYLRRTLRQLRGEIRAGTPIVGLEPSCVATFKHELRELLPHDDDAERLAGSVFHFAELVEEPPALSGKALLWGHCHHKATGGIEPEAELLRRMGLEVEEVKGGCCGVAGSWGYEKEHYDVSMACGEHALLPAVREAGDETLVVADGFSCKTQIEHGTARRALHLAEVLALARR